MGLLEVISEELREKRTGDPGFPITKTLPNILEFERFSAGTEFHVAL